MKQIAKELYEKNKNIKGYSSFYQTKLKRIFDLLLSVCILPIFLLIFIPVAILIKLDDNGPILYKSRRLGINFSEFDMYKFRTMKVNSPDLRNPDGSTYNSSNDNRLTKIGKYLRERSIDELPQIINVFNGSMSFIGPRPGDVESKDTYLIDEKDKLLVKPGITGFSQAWFRNNISVRDKRLYDAYYAHCVNFRMDFKIVIKTIATVIKRKNIYTNVE